MKTITVRDLQKKVRECVNAAQTDRVVITRHGKPAAVLVGVEGTDWETVVLESNARFWRLIERRRKEPTITMADMRSRVAARRAQPSKRR
jgi:prevent-host-death family protein